MGMSIDEAIEKLSASILIIGPEGQVKARDILISTARKYQKIEDIYYHQSGETLENSLRAVIEDGKID